MSSFHIVLLLFPWSLCFTEIIFALARIKTVSNSLGSVHFQELEPFPELDVFDRIRKFQQQLCQDYSPKEHLIKVYVRFESFEIFRNQSLLIWSLF